MIRRGPLFSPASETGTASVDAGGGIAITQAMLDDAATGQREPPDVPAPVDAVGDPPPAATPGETTPATPTAPPSGRLSLSGLAGSNAPAATPGADATTAPAADAAEGEPGFKTAANKEGLFFGGKFDRGDKGTFTAEFLTQNPHVAALADAHSSLEHEHGQMRRGKLESLQLSPEGLQQLDFSIGEDGNFGKKTMDSLVGKILTKEAVGMLRDTFVVPLATHLDTANQTWMESLKFGDGITLKTVADWAVSDQSTLTPAQVDKYDLMLNDPDMRDIAAERLFNEYAKSGISPNAPTETRTNQPPVAPNTNLGGGGGGAGFETHEEAMAAYGAALDTGDKAKIAAVERRMANSPRALAAIRTEYGLDQDRSQIQ